MIKNNPKIDSIETLEKILNSPDQSSNLTQDLITQLRQYFQDLCNSQATSKAETMILQLEKRPKSVKQIKMLADFCNLLSKNYKKLKKLEDSLRYAKKSLDYFLSYNPDCLQTAKSLLNLASVYSMMQKNGKSIKKLNLCLNLIKKLLKTENNSQIKKLFVVTLFNLASEEEKIGNYLEAEIKYKEVMVYAKSLNESAQDLIEAVVKALERVAKLIEKAKLDVSLTSNYKTKSGKRFNNQTTTFLRHKNKKSSSNPEDRTQKTQSRTLNSNSRSNNSYSPSIKKARSPSITSLSSNSGSTRKLVISPIQALPRVISPVLGSSSKCADFLPSVASSQQLSHLPKLNSSFSQSQSIESSLPNQSNPLFNSNRRPSEESTGLAQPLVPLNGSNNSNTSNAPNTSNTSNPLNPVNKEVTNLISHFFKPSRSKPHHISHTVAPQATKLQANQINETFANENRARVCILRSRLDFDMKFYSTAYFYKSSLFVIEVECSDFDRCWTTSFEINDGCSALEFIKGFIEPRLNLVDGQLVLQEACEVKVVQGSFIREKNAGVVSIVRMYPRWKVRVTMGDKEDYFDMAEIKPNFPHVSDLAKDKHFLLTLFVRDSKGIQVNLGTLYPLESIFDGTIENRYLNEPFHICIFRLGYLNNYSYLVRGKDENFSSILIENCVICKRIERLKPTLNEIINFIKHNLYIESSNLLIKEKSEVTVDPIFKKKFRINRGQTIISKNTELNSSQSLIKPQDIKENPSFFNFFSSFPEEEIPILVRSNTEKISLQDSFLKNENFEDSIEYNQFIFKGSKVFEEDFKNRIILRTCIIKNDQIYQISMSITKDEIVNFYIRKGSENENLNVFSIKLDLISEKTGISKEYIIPLGSFVLRNMLIIKDANICYFDFSRSVDTPIKAFDKLTSLLKGFIARRKFKLKLKQMAGKKKIKLEGLIYTCLVYLGNEILYLRLVRITEVLELNLALKNVVKDGLFKSVDLFLMNLNKIGLKIIDTDGKKKVVCNKKYSIVG